MTVEKFRQGSKFLGVTVILVAVTGFASWLSLTNPLDSVQGPGAELAVSSGRVPASTVASGQSVVQEIHCRKPPHKLALTGSHLRLRLVACPGMHKSEVSIRNETNGFTASVFKSPKDVTTDYIDLVDGANNLKIEIREDKSALREIEIEVTRAPASGEVAALPR